MSDLVKNEHDETLRESVDKLFKLDHNDTKEVRDVCQEIKDNVFKANDPLAEFDRLIDYIENSIKNDETNWRTALIGACTMLLYCRDEEIYKTTELDLDSVISKMLNKILNLFDEETQLAAKFLSNQLVFLEPGLSMPERQKIMEKIKEKTQEEDCLKEIMSVKDSLDAHEQREDDETLIITPSRKPLLKEISKKINTISIHSVKGGVGKTLLAHATARFISDIYKKKTCLIDLDFFGPSTQYLVNIPALYRKLEIRRGLDPDAGLKEYPDLSMYLTPEWAVRSRQYSIDDLFYEVSENLSYVLLTHNTLRLPQFSFQVRSDAGSSSVFWKLSGLIKIIADKGFEYLIIDSQPGLYSHQGQFIRFIINHVGAQMVIVSTPKAYDILASSYEIGWYASKSEFPNSTLFWVLNFWVSEYEKLDPIKLLQKFVDYPGKKDFGKGMRLLADCWALARYMLPDSNLSDTEGNCVYGNGRLEVFTLPLDNRIMEKSLSHLFLDEDFFDSVKKPNESAPNERNWFNEVKTNLVPRLMERCQERRIS